MSAQLKLDLPPVFLIPSVIDGLKTWLDLISDAVTDRDYHRVIYHSDLVSRIVQQIRAEAALQIGVTLED